MQALKPKRMLWVSYPKRSAKMKTGLTRDQGWDVPNRVGWQVVSLFSVDETWSTLRFRPAQEIGK